MTEKRIENLNIKVEQPIITPIQLKELYPLTENIINTVHTGQMTVKNILSREDKRQLVVVGPCSIHDVEVAKDYARRLKELSKEVEDTLYLVMRVYFEKPRTTVGWQGLVNDPFLDDSCQLEEGLKQSRELLTYIAELGLPAAGEALDIVTPQYIQDLFSWTAIGARTTESQSHRKMASGFSSAVGFKNGTDGNVKIAIQALESVASPHNFVSIHPDGKVAVVRTNGNPHTHLILRGGKEPNYDAESIARYESILEEKGFPKSIMVDCSHANSGKIAANQPKVLQSVGEQIANGNQSIMGVMIESNINHGKQSIPANIKELKYGVSVTDECLGFEETA
ncbi:MAG: 3-deoxy-7-phosphoheptulonate synthase [Bacteroidetes bacterium]|nr:MAG: 3-deoxy-7-phosphoheptulonate synthase [Bacteroidota bacterium]